MCTNAWLSNGAIIRKRIAKKEDGSNSEHWLMKIWQIRHHYEATLWKRIFGSICLNQKCGKANYAFLQFYCHFWVSRRGAVMRRTLSLSFSLSPSLSPSLSLSFSLSQSIFACMCAIERENVWVVGCVCKRAKCLCTNEIIWVWERVIVWMFTVEGMMSVCGGRQRRRKMGAKKERYCMSMWGTQTM